MGDLLAIEYIRGIIPIEAKEVMRIKTSREAPAMTQQTQYARAAAIAKRDALTVVAHGTRKSDGAPSTQCPAAARRTGGTWWWWTVGTYTGFITIGCGLVWVARIE